MDEIRERRRMKNPFCETVLWKRADMKKVDRKVSRWR